jgi:hypothetical protein
MGRQSVYGQGRQQGYGWAAAATPEARDDGAARAEKGDGVPTRQTPRVIAAPPPGRPATGVGRLSSVGILFGRPAAGGSGGGIEHGADCVGVSQCRHWARALAKNVPRRRRPFGASPLHWNPDPLLTPRAMRPSAAVKVCPKDGACRVSDRLHGTAVANSKPRACWPRASIKRTDASNKAGKWPRAAGGVQAIKRANGRLQRAYGRWPMQASKHFIDCIRTTDASVFHGKQPAGRAGGRAGVRRYPAPGRRRGSAGRGPPPGATPRPGSSSMKADERGRGPAGGCCSFTTWRTCNVVRLQRVSAR